MVTRICSCYQSVVVIKNYTKSLLVLVLIFFVSNKFVGKYCLVCHWYSTKTYIKDKKKIFHKKTKKLVSVYLIANTMLFKKFQSCFFISNTFTSNTRLKSTNNQAEAKQHPEAELLLFENYSLSSCMLTFKNNRRYSKKWAKMTCACFNEIIWFIIMKAKSEAKSEKIDHTDTT